VGGRECMRKSGKGMVAREIAEVKGEEEGTTGRRVRERINFEKPDLIGGSKLEGGKGEGEGIRGERLVKE